MISEPIVKAQTLAPKAQTFCEKAHNSSKSLRAKALLRFSLGRHVWPLSYGAGPGKNFAAEFRGTEFRVLGPTLTPKSLSF